MNLTLRAAERILLGGADTAPENDVTFGNVCTDSRAVERGDLFVCIEGERFDGHEFAESAVRSGAAAVLASRMLDLPVPVLMVRDTVRGMGLLARACRDQAKARVVAVTGSAGKTTVKEMLATVASRECRVSRNAGNLNNQIGLPLSIFRADPESDLWVLELGISRAHDMDELGPVASPDMAVIHNIGPAHLEGLGDLRGVARAKASLLRHLRPDGLAVINADHELLREQALLLRPDATLYSTRDENFPYFCTFLGVQADGQGRYLVRTPDFELEADLPFCGAHFAENIGATAASAHLLGLSKESLLLGLAEARPPAQRFACSHRGGVTIIDDTYNANPLSMRGAVATAREMAVSGGGCRPLVLVLGDMKELGSGAAEEHVGLGRHLRAMDPAAVFFHGEHALDVARGYGENGSAVEPVASPENLLRRWRQLGLSNAVVLFKGSRSCRMEDYAGALCRELDSTGEDGR
ncbi:UDP-N-acetylmuramoyl-tripeptide--D-alanyl-D-alanine ligase [Paucidesulfovibrio longus]|uniref:UDP-N-acetylmuramoyl-tripeptide--D-alanyl-D- alanine ligase n=1 Tax=Paucidesulfovibrio longus TaxID=889 RepID=UPI0003B4883D|nr:UDP-N-acetylmuramoyl-tripeptide--D-alanyl-D-alanine ligase [Paucidesulfovibrio longus]